MRGGGKRLEAVIDSSAILGCQFADESSTQINQLLAELPTARIFVPMIWHAEMANAFLMSERRNRSTPDESAGHLAYLADFIIIVDDAPYPFAAILNLARQYHLTAYDATYLELSMRLNLPLATLDKAMRKAAQKLGIQVIL